MWQTTVFRTYLKGRSEGDGKACADKHSDTSFGRTWDDVQQFDCFGAVLNPGYVDISFDSKTMYAAFLDMAEANDWKCLALSSEHGGHTYWRSSDHMGKDGHDRMLAVGFVADIHSRNTYIPLRVHGHDRFPPDYDIFEGEEYQIVPPELWAVKTKESLWQMADGDGRNDTIFRYILTLQRAGMANDTIKAILTNTNKFVFKAPMDKDELSIILRDEAFQKPNFFSEKGVFLFNEFATYLSSQLNVVHVNDQLHIYQNGMYITGYKNIESQMIEIIPNLKDNQRKEVLKYLELIADTKKPADARYIAFRNGVYDIVSGQLLPFTPDLIVTNQIPWNYDLHAYDALADQTLDKLSCNDESIRALLEECIGYCMYRRNELGKAFILTGEKNNGKSTFLSVLKTLLGSENVSALDINSLDQRFSTAQMFDRLANIGDDISDEFLQGSQVAQFKKVVTGDRITAEKKGQDPFEFEPYVKLVFSANEIPRMKDKTGAVLRRLVIIPFNASFSKLDPDYDPFIKYKLESAPSIQYLIQCGIDGLCRVLETSGFTESDAVSEEMVTYEERNNPIVGFITEVGAGSIVDQRTTDVYARYQVYCHDNALSPMSKFAFTKVVKDRLNIDVKNTSVNNKSVRIFVKI